MATMPSRILLTGADGFVGQRVVPMLKERLGLAARIYAFGRSGKGPDGTEPLIGDLTDAASVRAAVAATRPEAVLHLAAVALPAAAREAPREAWDVNLHGTLNLASAVMAEAPEARFVHVSTSEVYGAAFNGQSGPLNEAAGFTPLSVYGATKAAGDIAIRQMAADGLRAVVFRPFNHTGAGQSDAYVVPGFAAQIVRIERGDQPPVIEVGNLDAERDFLDVADVARAYTMALMGAGEPTPGTAFNLASGTPRTIRSMLEGFIGLARIEIKIRINPTRLRPNDVPRTWGDNRAARDGMGWAPKISFETTLRDVLNDKRSGGASILPTLAD
jgi:GDP-4-dehydro-6-deoxy-D-mannose reductase